MSLLNLLKLHAREAASVALFVGSVLLLINQYDALFGDQPLRWTSGLLTYCVPFCVYLLGKQRAGCD